MATVSTASGSVSIDLLFTEVLSDSGLKSGPVTSQLAIGPIHLGNGTTVGKVNRVYADRQVGIGAGATTSYDLQTLLDSAGNALALDSVSLIAVRNNSSSAANFLAVGPSVANPFGVLAGVSAGKGFVADATDKVIVQAKNADSTGGTWFVIYADGGIPVDGTHKSIDLLTDAGSSGNAWDILIVGRDT